MENLSFLFSVYIKFFFIMTPFFVTSVFLSMTKGIEEGDKKKLSIKVTFAIAIACFIVLFFGKYIFDLFGITLDAFRIGAGALLFLTAVDLVQKEVNEEPTCKGDIAKHAVVPLAIPVTVGPGTVGALMVTAYTIKKDNIFNLKIVGQPKGYTNFLRIGVRKDEPILRDILNLGVSSMTPDEQKQIVNKYVYIKYESNTQNYRWLIYSILILGFVIALILLINHQLRKKIDKEVQKNLEHSKVFFQQSKQAALGSLMANISHQWRDNLTKISYINLTLRTHIIQNKEIPPTLLDHSTQEIEQTIDFMSQTMQSFLDYYKPSTMIHTFEVYDSIQAVIRIMDTRIKNSHCLIHFQLDEEDTLHLHGIRNEWMQVWMNIILNALIAAEKSSIAQPMLNITFTQNSIIFQDNCGGIETKILDNLNNDIFTGLGIKMCKDIACKYSQEFTIQNFNDGLQITLHVTKNPYM